MQLKEWLDEKKPPPGGLTALRRKISEREGRTGFSRRWVLASGGLTSVLLLLLFAFFYLGPEPGPELLYPADQIALGIQSPPADSPLFDISPRPAGVGLVKILDNERVVYYQIIRPVGDPASAIEP